MPGTRSVRGTAVGLVDASEKDTGGGRDIDGAGALVEADGADPEDDAAAPAAGGED